MSESREQILAVAYNLFLQKSYKEVSIQKITNSVGMTKGAFYYFFNSKEALFHEVFNRFMISVLSIDYTQFSHDSLYQFYHDYLDYMARRKQPPAESGGGIEVGPTINLYALIFETIKNFPALGLKVKESQLVEQKSWEEMVQIARNKGEIKSPMCDEEIASVFIFISDGLGMRSMMEENQTNIISKILPMWNSFYAELKA